MKKQESLLLHVKYQAKSGKREAFLKEILESGILEQIRKEDGYLGYAYYCDAVQPDGILLVEEWESKAKQEKHLLTPHMMELKKIKEHYIADTVVREMKISKE